LLYIKFLNFRKSYLIATKIEKTLKIVSLGGVSLGGGTLLGYFNVRYVDSAITYRAQHFFNQLETGPAGFEF
jgi:hypothetical protein